MTQSMQKALFYGDDEALIKYERDSADLTMSRIPLSSRGTDAGLSGIEESKERLDDDDDSHESPKLSEIVVEKTMTRQMTMKPEDEQQMAD